MLIRLASTACQNFGQTLRQLLSLHCIQRGPLSHWQHPRRGVVLQGVCIVVEIVFLQHSSEHLARDQRLILWNLIFSRVVGK